MRAPGRRASRDTVRSRGGSRRTSVARHRAARSCRWRSASLSHIVWDLFTHEGRVGRPALPVLDEQWGPLTGYKWLQYGSSVLGLVILGRVGGAVAVEPGCRRHPLRRACCRDGCAGRGGCRFRSLLVVGMGDRARASTDRSTRVHDRSTSRIGCCHRRARCGGCITVALVTGPCKCGVRAAPVPLRQRAAPWRSSARAARASSRIWNS